MAVQVRGTTGTIKYGYHVVARLTAWHLDGNGRLESEVSEPNAFWLESGGPFTAVLHVGKKQWIWKGIEIAQLEPSLVAMLPGSPTVQPL